MSCRGNFLFHLLDIIMQHLSKLYVKKFSTYVLVIFLIVSVTGPLRCFYMCMSKKIRIIKTGAVTYLHAVHCCLEPPKCLENKLKKKQISQKYHFYTSSLGQLLFHRTNTDKRVQNWLQNGLNYSIICMHLFNQLCSSHPTCKAKLYNAHYTFIHYTTLS